MDNTSVIALLDVSDSQAMAIERVPAIMDFYFLPDMGRMNWDSSPTRWKRCSCTRVMTPSRVCI